MHLCGKPKCPFKCTVHENLWFECDQCEYKASQKGNLKMHIQFKHEGLAFSCDQCNYTSKLKGAIKRHKLKNIHIQSQQPSKEYKCNQCDFSSARRQRPGRELRNHMKSKHFNCDRCDHQATSDLSLKTHTNGTFGTEK